MKQKTKRKRRKGWFVLAALLAMFIGPTCYLQWYALKAEGNKRGKNIEASYAFMYKHYPFLVHWVDSLKQADALRDTFIRADDGTKLHALYLYADTATACTAIAVHGYTDNAIGMLHIAYLYNHDLHYNVLLPDLRFSGLSGGNHIQMEWNDRKDVLRWMQVANKLFAPDSMTNMVVHGISMGAATTVNVSGEKLPPYVHCVIEDCGYTSVWDEYTDQLKKQFNLPAFPILYITSWATDLRYGWNFKEASPLEQVKKCRLPMLFIHGTKDTFVPTWMGDSLYAAKPGIKSYWRVPGVTHAVSYLKYPKDYTERVKRFVEQYNVPKVMNNLPRKVNVPQYEESI
ncbi:MAG: alpha/beta hydrolase [Paraprevotella sp.]|nr:alpha/beta hydrolase [Paraprevotella sp.]